MTNSNTPILENRLSEEESERITSATNIRNLGQEYFSDLVDKYLVSE